MAKMSSFALCDFFFWIKNLCNMISASVNSIGKNNKLNLMFKIFKFLTSQFEYYLGKDIPSGLRLKKHF